MFKSKTVFIVGAGASYETGLPLGVKLKDIIAGKLRFRFDYKPMPETGDQILARQIMLLAQHGSGFSQAEYFEAANAICRGLPLAISIDNFIDAHRHDGAVERVGKLAIFQSILEAERSSRLFAEHIHSINQVNLKSVAETWMMSFFRMASEGVSRDEVAEVFQNVGFISFNYDRCIEQFLESALRAYYGVERAEAAAVVKEVPIFHPYGTLGSIFDRPNQQTLPFGKEPAHLNL